MDNIINSFCFNGECIEKHSYGNGHINDTIIAIFKDEDDKINKYILQRINKYVFKDPEALMENIVNITSYLKDEIIKNHGDYKRETLNVIFCKDGKSFYIDENGEYYRAFEFIEGTVSYDRIEKLEDFYESGVILGKFHNLLKDFPAETLNETIKDFHNTKKRIENLKKAINEDAFDRVKLVKNEIDFALSKEDEMGILVDMQERGELPLKVTHNDTKLNNILIDKKTNKGICLIDLDTVMPGLLVNDFGESIRFGANTAAEDEKDLKKVSLNLELFETYLKGFLDGMGDGITENEIDMLCMGAKVMTYENGIRFLTDYLENDKYFKISREGHNLDRCRVQFKLIEEMDEKWDSMIKIVKSYR